MIMNKGNINVYLTHNYRVTNKDIVIKKFFMYFEYTHLSKL